KLYCTRLIAILLPIPDLWSPTRSLSPTRILCLIVILDNKDPLRSIPLTFHSARPPEQGDSAFLVTT
ncbi:MAG: hypothetical protein J6U94_02905, partial [Paludibacteraceae bacterium]|nr:hypothetical protein [Paludibacteraceae bacterium]